MSSKLPNEILIKIFHQLHQNDQVECMLVCKHWSQLIERFTLYQTMVVHSAASMKKLLDKIQKNSDIANRIERMMININAEEKETSRQDHNTLLSLLPNLKTLHTSANILTDDEDIYYPWCNTIEHLSEYSDYSDPQYPDEEEDSDDSIVYRLLSSNACPNLTSLKIDSATFSAFSILKNAPALTRFSSEEGGEINIRVLELIHRNLPKLEYIAFPCILHSGSFEFDGDLVPAPTITECKFMFSGAAYGYTGSHNIDHVVTLLKYITEKYINLESLALEICSDVLSEEDTENMENNGWTPLFQTFGTQLKKLHLDGEDFCAKLFDIIDRYDCKINDLCFKYASHETVEKMARSQQALHIQTLYLNDTNCGSLDWLQYLPAIHHLKIKSCVSNGADEKIQMTDIFNYASPTLESLSLWDISLNIDYNYTGISDVKALSLYSTNLNDKMDTFIQRCFPKLSKLELNHCNLIGKAFDISTISLLSFCYEDSPTKSASNFVSIETLWNQEQRFYSFHYQQYKLVFNTIHGDCHPQNYERIKSFPASEMSNTVPIFTLRCNSLGSLSFSY